MQTRTLLSTVAAILALALTGPAAAQDCAEPIPENTPEGSSPGTIGEMAYDNPRSGSIFQHVSLVDEKGWDVHLSRPGDLVSFTVTLFASGAPWDATIRFYANTPDDSFTPNNSAPLLEVTIPGVPGQTIWTQTIDLVDLNIPPVPVGQDLWITCHAERGGVLLADGSILFDATAPFIGGSHSIRWLGAPDNVAFGGTARWPLATIRLDPIDLCNDPDTDGDGFTDVEELEVGTKPHIAASAPVMYENFDCLPAGTPMDAVNGWRAYFNETFRVAFTSDDAALSGTNSLEIVGLPHKPSDMIYEFDGITSGQWVLRASIFVPHGFAGTSHIWLLNRYDAGTNAYDESTSIDISAAGTISSVGDNGAVLPLVTGEWVEFRMELDLDADTQTIYYDEQLLLHDSWTAGIGPVGDLALKGFNVWTWYNESSSIYYDNISLLPAALPNEPPVAVCDPLEITVEAEGSFGALIDLLDGTGSFDPDGDAITYHWDVSNAAVELEGADTPIPAGIFPIGITMATLTVSDGYGGVDTCDVLVTVQDTTPPEVMSTSDLAMLWPPNHSMRTVRLIVTGTDVVANPQDITIMLLTVRSDEPDDESGDGSDTGDVNGDDGYSAPVDFTSSVAFDPDAGANGAWVVDIQLRAERAGGGDGRCYTVDVVAIDTSGNAAEASCCIVVPHDRRNH